MPPGPPTSGTRLRPSRPLLVYLDLNKWIDLAHAESGTARGKDYEPALKAAERLVSEGQAIFPLSSAHFFEVAKIGNDNQRRTLARLMVRLSLGNFLLPASALIGPELRRVIGVRFQRAVVDTPTLALTRSIQKSFVSEDELSTSEQFNDLMLDSPFVLEELLATARTSPKFLDRWKRFAEGHEEGRALRWDASKAVRKRAYCALVTMGIQDRLALALAEFNLTMGILETLGQNGCVALLEAVPFLDIEINLHVERNEHRDRPIAPNDEIDLGFLSMAVPYCHVVITEKFWTNLIHRLKLDQKYDTFVSSDLNDILHLDHGTPTGN
jgi:hypothetical protein